MNKFSEYLSVKISIIVAGVYVMLNVYFDIEPLATFTVAALISFALWLSVWDFVQSKTLPAYKRHAIFAIHVAASVIPPAVGIFYVNFIAGNTI